MKQLKAYPLFLSLLILLAGCLSNDLDINTGTYSAEELSVISTNLNLPTSPFSYSFDKENEAVQNDHMGTLGRTLFYDKNLSADASVSCASCHQQSLAFSDNVALSVGAHGNLTKRNSIALGSLSSFGRHYDVSKFKVDKDAVPGLFWDERAATIKEQLKQTINNPNEMGIELDQITDLVESTDYYRILYQKAFNTTTVTEDNILESIEAFINSISSRNSKFEADIIGNLNFISGDAVTGVLENEQGLQLFINHCNTCHGNSLSVPFELEKPEQISVANNGLINSSFDLGVYEATQDPEDEGKFKIPGLLNVELTAPYMHDGRFSTLEEVIDYYSSGINSHPNLHPALKDGDEAARFNWTDEEKTALVDFLKSLTSEEITTNEKWSDPFLK